MGDVFQHDSHHFEMRRKASFSKLTKGVANRLHLDTDKQDGCTEKRERLFRLMSHHSPSDVTSITKSIMKHIEYSLAKNYFNFDQDSAYRAGALSVRDRLLEHFNDTSSYFHEKDVKRCYYLSLEFLVGRAMQNALVNLDVEDNYKKAVEDIGYQLEELYECEHDAALGNGGLGRLAACFMDSCATLNLPVWGYGIRYTYGIFEQKIIDGCQTEFPDYWLVTENPWEIRRPDVTYGVRFGGHVHEYKDDQGRHRHRWTGGTIVQAQAYDNPVPGFDTYNCNNLRLWRALPSKEFDFHKFNTGNYLDAIAERQNAEAISAVLYPNDSTRQGRELRLRQQYFFVCATLQDVLRRFKKVPDRTWAELPKKVTMQLNDTHPNIAIPELMRVLLDVEGLGWTEAWDITCQCFNYTNHTVLPEALEKWPADLIRDLLPRHLQIINEINFQFLNRVKAVFGNDFQRLSRLSIYEEGHEKCIRMANLGVIGSYKVNGVAAIHTDLVRRDLFPEFVEFYNRVGEPDKIVNMTNGVTPRRWIHCANRGLSNLISSTLGSDQWLKDLRLIQGIENYADDEDFVAQWKNVKTQNKVALADWVLQKTGVQLDPHMFLFDIQVKRIHEYKRQLLFCFYMIHKYLTIKAMTHEQREAELVPRVSMIGGKAAPGYAVAKTIIKLCNNIAEVVNNDPEVNRYFKVVFLPNYNVSSAQVIIPAADLSEQISTAGTEASGTGNMKFVMNGGLIVGTLDGANVEIREECGPETMFLFGARETEVSKIRHRAREGKYPINEELSKVFEAVYQGRFSLGDKRHHSEFCGVIERLLNNGNGHNGDFYLVCHDFADYVRVQAEADRHYKDHNVWWRLSIQAASRMSKFSTDRTIADYANEIWHILPCERTMSTGQGHPSLPKKPVASIMTQKTELLKVDLQVVTENTPASNEKKETEKVVKAIDTTADN
ncbi:MAG: uncharacterized protein KVP18_002760 [Porospora cf. gigantea A]|uniref:uncharacterized protein n=1 Tax=Porospora cf. gigantea A TaxID=2853593 RepID=UPI00355A73D3|nr:MAG: hypothetical protein KVP18_002760 [Porospora cf. gigantea A]